ncbi:MAG: 4'-phosphopantetheinyl transferase superfamily protein [Bacteroidales bacterium]
MPLHQITPTEGGFTVGLWQISEDPATLLAMAHLSEEERLYLVQIKNTIRQLHWLAWRALLRQMLGSPHTKILYDEKGRPFLQNQPFQISVSHAGPWAACQIHPNQPAGVDVESIRPRIAKVKERFLSKKELQKHASFLSNLRHLTILWCIKEAVFKWADMPGLDFRNQIHILPFLSQPQGLASCLLKSSDNVETQIELHYENIDAEHIIAYVTHA